MYETQIHDAMVVRRAVTLGMPVVLLSQDSADSTQENVLTDYRRLASELIRQGAD